MPRTLGFALFLIPALALIVGGHIFWYRRMVADLTTNRVIRLAAVAWLCLAALAGPSLRLLSEVLPPAALRPLTLAVNVWLGLLLYTVGVRAALWAAQGILLRVRGRPGASAPATLSASRTAADGSAPPGAVSSAPRPSPETSEAARPEAAGSGAAEPGVDRERRALLAAGLAGGAWLAGGGFAAYGAWRAFEPAEVTEVPVRLPHLPRALEGFTLVQLTDIHVGPIVQRRFLDALVAQANAARPDLIAITGDLVDGTPAQLGGFVAALANLRARHGTYFVTGNHDYYSGADRWVSVVAGLGITPLRNRRVTIGEPKASFQLAGVDDWGSRDSPHLTSGYDLEKALEGFDADQPSVLLAHQPMNLPEVMRRGVGLQLSGHTHGGQLFPLTTVTDVFYGARNHGLSRAGDTQLYTSRGCGFVGPPMRVGSPPEIVKIVLLPA